MEAPAFTAKIEIGLSGKKSEVRDFKSSQEICDCLALEVYGKRAHVRAP